VVPKVRVSTPVCTIAVLAALSALGMACNPQVETSDGVSDAPGGPLADPQAAAEWVLASTPIMEWGQADPAQGVYFFRVTSAAFGDSVIYVADGGAAQLWVLDENGQAPRSVGRQGQGPGEFMLPTDVQVLGNRGPFVWDARQRRLSEFEPGGTLEHAASAVSSLPPSDPWLVGLPDNGDRFLIASQRLVPPSGGGITHDSITVTVHARDGELVDTIGTFLGAPRIWADRRPSPQLFGSTSHIDSNGRDTWVLDGADGHAFRLWPPPQRIVSWNAGSRTIPSGWASQYVADRLSTASNSSERRLLEANQTVPLPTRFPAADGLMVDSNGRIWIHRGSDPTDGSEGGWLVADTTGALIGRIQVPDDAQVADAMGNRVLLIREDTLGVERISIFRFSRGGG
jgi:6-bladed beta-propeller protein